MNKKIIIPLGVIFVLAIVIFFIKYKDNKIVSTITLDINPSIELNLTNDKVVKSVIALNDDAKEIISGSIEGKSLEDALNIITTNLIEKDYINTNELVDIILYADGSLSSNNVKKSLTNSLNDKNISPNIIVIDSITEEDKELSKKYNVTPAKVSYIKRITNDNKNINIDTLVNKSVNELKETKETGKYCDTGFFLEADWCYKEIDKVPASNGMVCPGGYNNVDNDRCINFSKMTNKQSGLVCDGLDWRLKGNMCIIYEIVPVKHY